MRPLPQLTRPPPDWAHCQPRVRWWEEVHPLLLALWHCCPLGDILRKLKTSGEVGGKERRELGRCLAQGTVGTDCEGALQRRGPHQPPACPRAPLRSDHHDVHPGHPTPRQPSGALRQGTATGKRRAERPTSQTLETCYGGNPKPPMRRSPGVALSLLRAPNPPLHCDADPRPPAPILGSKGNKSLFLPAPMYRCADVKAPKIASWSSHSGAGG